MDVKAYAKINLGLRVTAKREDGFHDIETIFQTISLHDTLSFTPANELTLTCDAPEIPTDETNLVLRAALKLEPEAKDEAKLRSKIAELEKQKTAAQR